MTIALETCSEGQVIASIYDVAGRRVRGLSDAILNAGSHNLLWDGRDDTGRVAPPGIYFVRVSTPKGSATGRLVVIR